MWFFSLDAASRLAVAAARVWFHLPYFRARMSCAPHGEDVVYASMREHAGAPPAELIGRYGPRGGAVPRSGRHARALADRALLPLYAGPARGAVRAEIHHRPWALESAEAAFERNTMAAAHGIDLPGGAPHLLFARRQGVVAWAPRRVSARG